MFRLCLSHVSLLPHKVAAFCGAPKNLLNIFQLFHCQGVTLGNPGATMARLPVVFIKCSFRFQFSFSFFFLCFFLFTPRKVKVLPAHCPFQCPLILAYYIEHYHTRAAVAPAVLSPAPETFVFHKQREREKGRGRDNRIELSSVSVDIERIVTREREGGRERHFPLSLWSTRPRPRSNNALASPSQLSLSSPVIVLALFNVSKYSLSSFLCFL